MADLFWHFAFDINARLKQQLGQGGSKPHFLYIDVEVCVESLQECDVGVLEDLEGFGVLGSHHVRVKFVHGSTLQTFDDVDSCFVVDKLDPSQVVFGYV